MVLNRILQLRRMGFLDILETIVMGVIIGLFWGFEWGFIIFTISFGFNIMIYNYWNLPKCNACNKKIWPWQYWEKVKDVDTENMTITINKFHIEHIGGSGNEKTQKPML